MTGHPEFDHPLRTNANASRKAGANSAACSGYRIKNTAEEQHRAPARQYFFLLDNQRRPNGSSAVIFCHSHEILTIVGSSSDFRGTRRCRRLKPA